MSSPDSVYTARIGPFSSGTTVDYFVTATNDAGFTRRKPLTGHFDFYVGERTIYEIQFVDPGGDSSSYAGRPVNTSGVVTAGAGELSENYFYIQETNANGKSAAFRGIRVYDRTGTVMVSRGDSVTVSGDVEEFFGETEIALFFPGAVTVHHVADFPIDPHRLSTAEMATQEAWEGVLVMAEDAEVTDANVGFGEWEITSGLPADPLIPVRVGDYGDYSYTPMLGDDLHVTGIMTYAFSYRMLQPRDDDDIVELGVAGRFIRGDDDGDGELTISDPILSLCVQFGDCDALGCLDASDVDDDGEITISDAIYNLAAQFASGPEPPAPFPACGDDPTVDALDCLCHAHCMDCGMPGALTAARAETATDEADGDGAETITSVSLRLAPNPSAGGTAFRYALPHGGHVKLVIYNVEGREVTRVIDSHHGAGRYEVGWDRRNARGRAVPSGIYFCRFRACDTTLTEKLILLQ
jgi:hypothetical protein